ncbi:MAG: competence/damage-inducible protein A [Planctomyces sp.]|nr:competence/damage-inducible protein A [Planctomyces sp.]
MSASDPPASGPLTEPAHTAAAVLSTGDEIMLGQLQDTNARWLSERLAQAGVPVVAHMAVGDDLARLTAALRGLVGQAPLVIMTGGLGPTDGDLTRAALAALQGEPLIEDPAALEALRARLAARGRALSDRNRRQATRPVSAACLHNAHGTAPGLRLRAGPGLAEVFALPGPPGELRPMFLAHVEPALRPAVRGGLATTLLHLAGVPESDAAERIADLTARGGESVVNITASGGVLTVRIRSASALGPGAARAEAERLAALARQRLAPYVFGADAETLQGVLVRRLAQAGQRLAVAESCTAGLLGATIASVPGASAVLDGGWITYSNGLKVAQLGVPEATLAQHGAVSVQTAAQMAAGALARCAATHALAVTGIAGPDGGTPDKPVGTVCIAHAQRTSGGAEVVSRRLLIAGDRQDVRERACRAAMSALEMHLRGERSPGVLWQIGPATREFQPFL